MRKVYPGIISALVGVILCGPVWSAEQKFEDRVNTLVTGYYIRGVPYGAARDLGAEAVPHLAKALRDESMKPHWKNTVQILNYVGAPTSFPILRHFIMDRFKGEIDQETYLSISAAIVTMGPLARISPQAFQFLANGSNPKSWAPVRWTFRDSKSEKRNIQMSRDCLNALATSGMAEADHLLTEFVRTKAGNPYWAQLQDVIEAAITYNRGVMKEGFENHLKRRDSTGGGVERP
jgi:hypothetical protein